MQYKDNEMIRMRGIMLTKRLMRMRMILINRNNNEDKECDNVV